MGDVHTAICGIGCIFSSVASADDLWLSALAGRQGFRGVDAGDGPQMAKSVIATLDASRTTSSDELMTLAPQQAIEDARIDLNVIDSFRAAVIVARPLAEDEHSTSAADVSWIAQALDNGVAPQVSARCRIVEEGSLAGRVAPQFGLTGPTLDLDAGRCSSHLAVALGLSLLRSDAAELVLCCAIQRRGSDPSFTDADADPERDPVMRPYDKWADTALRGEGAAAVALAARHHAEVRGWRRRAFLTGWSVSAAPDTTSDHHYRTSLLEACRKAGRPLDTLGYLEGNGAGRADIDAAEVSAIAAAIASQHAQHPLRIASVAPIIGDCGHAAGLAGLALATQAVERGTVPPSVNCIRPIQAIAKANGAVRPTGEGGPWPAINPQRCAAVGCMSDQLSAHLVIEQSDTQPAEPVEDTLALRGSLQQTELFVLAGETRAALISDLQTLLEAVAPVSMAQLTDLSAASLSKPRRGDHRLAFVCATPWALAQTARRVLDALRQDQPLESLDAVEAGIFAGRPVSAPRVVMLFPGQGSQRINMGRDYWRRYPAARALTTACDDDLRDLLDHPLSDYIFRDAIAAPRKQMRQWETTLRDTRIAQPAITLSSAAILRVLRDLGLQPDSTMGHSLGEIAALHAAGAMDARTAVRIAALRSRAMAALELADNGAMAAVRADAATVEPLIREVDARLTIGNYNAPDQTVVSGPTGAIDALVIAADRRGIEATALPVSHAFHSPIVAGAAAAFRQQLESIDFGDLHHTCIAASTGRTIEPGANLRHLLADAIRLPVNFIAATREAARLDPTLWIEVGPHGVLAGLVREILGLDEAMVMTTDHPKFDGHTQLNRIIARGFVQGLPVRPDRLMAHRHHRALVDAPAAPGLARPQQP